MMEHELSDITSNDGLSINGLIHLLYFQRQLGRIFPGVLIQLPCNMHFI